MEWSNDLLSEFLELYEKEPSIWNPSDPRHKNRNNIQDSWKNISDNLSVKFSISELKKKKDSLMSTFRKLASKVRASKKTGSGTDDVYKPDWFAYEKMATFLHGVFQPRMTISSEKSLDQSTVDAIGVNKDVYDNTEEDYEESPLTTTIEEHFKSPAIRKKRKATDNTIEIESRMDEAYNILKKASVERSPDICSLYAELLAKKLRDFDDNTREIAMHEIDNYLFNLKHNRTQPNYLPQTRHEIGRAYDIIHSFNPSPSSLTEYTSPSPHSQSSSSSYSQSHITIQNPVPGPSSSFEHHGRDYERIFDIDNK